jgi:hypothetical protein
MTQRLKDLLSRRRKDFTMSRARFSSSGDFSSSTRALCMSVVAAVSLVSCGSEDPLKNPPASGGAGGSATAAGTGGGGASGGKSAGGTGVGTGGGGMSGSNAPGGGTAGGAPPNAGSPSTGGIAGTDAVGGQGPGGAPASGGTGGSTMAGVGGSTGSAGAGSGDSFVSGVTITVHKSVSTILVVTWTQAIAAEETWLEFTFEAGNVMTSRPKPGTVGAHRDVVLGVPASTPITVRIVSKQGGVEHETRDYMGTTGALPKGLPVPSMITHDPAKASPDRFMLGAVEDSKGGCANTTCFYNATFWLYIMDRKGRMVWYYADPASNATSSFQRIARDGEYIWIEKRPFGGSGTRSVLKRTLDGEYSEEIAIPNLADCIDVTSDGSLLYDAQNELRERTKAGTTRAIWNCREAFGQSFKCYTNTVNWNELDDTVLMSFPDMNTVVEIDRQSGELVGQYGARAGSYAFVPATWEFQFQHFANITKDGTLLVSSHMPGNPVTSMPTAGEHAFMEFTIDRTARTLTEKWVYNAGQEWAMYKGMAIRLPNGNTLANYGTGGVIREITPAKETVFHVKFDTTTGTNDFFNKMVGHNVLLDDLYKLNGGGPQ